MRKLLNGRIPVILGIFLVFLVIPLTIFLLKNQTVFKSNASDSQEPQDIKITNISDQSFTITYQTDVPSTGSISYDYDKKLGKSELENIDKEKGSFSPKKIHNISLKKLTPATKYYFSIISGSNTFLNNGIPFEAITGPIISSTSAKQQIIKGEIVLPDGNIPPETLIYLNAENSQLLSNTINENGKFNFSLKELRTDDLSSYFNINDNTVFKIFATDGSLESTALISLNQEDSVPTITLSNDYDFTQGISPIASKSTQFSGFPLATPSEKKSKPEIINPKENQSFTEPKPQFRGTSLPNEKVEIVIHSEEELTAQVTADNNGNWIYKPSANLSPGIHTITIKTRDSSGILTTIIRSFTVFAAETTQAPTPSILPTSTPIPIKTIAPSPTITVLVPTPTSTITPFPTLVPVESKGGLPPTGKSPILLITVGIVAIISGLALSLLTRAIL